MTVLPALPIVVDLYPDETLPSYWDRRCEANEIKPKDAWLALRQEDRTFPILVKPRSALVHIGVLVGLADGALLRDSGGVACGRGGAKRQLELPTCRVIAAAVPLRGRCAAGVKVVVTWAHGLICVRHRIRQPGNIDLADLLQLSALRAIEGRTEKLNQAQFASEVARYQCTRQAVSA